jgi:hypothetical protein
VSSVRLPVDQREVAIEHISGRVRRLGNDVVPDRIEDDVAGDGNPLRGTHDDAKLHRVSDRGVTHPAGRTSGAHHLEMDRVATELIQLAHLLELDVGDLNRRAVRAGHELRSSSPNQCSEKTTRLVRAQCIDLYPGGRWCLRTSVPSAPGGGENIGAERAECGRKRGRRANPKSAGLRANPREHAAIGKEIPTGELVGTFNLVEAAGIEPASANDPQTALHAYPAYFGLTARLAGRRADAQPVAFFECRRHDSTGTEPL